MDDQDQGEVMALPNSMTSSSVSTDANNGNGNNGNGGNVCVAVRIRPLIEREELSGSQNCWKSDSKYLQQIDVETRRFAPNQLPHVFDHVFGVSQNTTEVYNQVISPIISEAFNGFNGTVLCYGQTSSGKTFTLYGNDHEEGIISIAARDLFNRIKNDTSNSYIVRVGLLEIYNEKVSDLLTGNDVTISEVGGVVVPKNLTEIQVWCPQDVLDNVRKVQSQRKIGETRMNKESSRSHTILRIQLEIVPRQTTGLENGDEIQVANALLNFVDLAGSEKAGQTGAQGDRFREATYINKSLSVLAQVAMQLTSGSSGDVPLSTSMNVTASASGLSKRAQSSRYINFRDSKLTHILKNSLSGNAYTVIICNVTPAVFSLEETLSTLRFAKTAKTIKTAPKPNHKLLNNEESKQKINELQAELSRKQSEVDCLRNQLGAYEQFARRQTPKKTDKTLPSCDYTERRNTWCPTSKPLRGRSLPNAGLTDRDKLEQETDYQPLERLGSLGVPTSKCEPEVFMSTKEALIHFDSVEKEKQLNDITLTPKPIKRPQSESFVTPKVKEDVEVQTDFNEPTSPQPPRAKKSRYGTDLDESTIARTPAAASRKIRTELCVALIDQANDVESLKKFHSSELEVEKARVQELEQKYGALECEYEMLERSNKNLIRAKESLLEQVELFRTRDGNEEDDTHCRELKAKVELLTCDLVKSKKELDEVKNTENSIIQSLQEQLLRMEAENKELEVENVDLLARIEDMEIMQGEVFAELRKDLEEKHRLCELAAETPPCCDQSVQACIVSDSLDQYIQTETALQTDEDVQTDEMQYQTTVARTDQILQTDDTSRSEESVQTEEVLNLLKAEFTDQEVQTESPSDRLSVEDNSVQTDEVQTASCVSQFIQTECILQMDQDIQTDDILRSVVVHQDIQTDDILRSVVVDQDMQTDNILGVDQVNQTDDVERPENIDKYMQTKIVLQTHQDMQTDTEVKAALLDQFIQTEDSPKAMVSSQCMQTDDVPRIAVADRDVQTEETLRPVLLDQNVQTVEIAIVAQLVQTDNVLCTNRFVQTNDQPKVQLHDECCQTDQAPQVMAPATVGVEQSAQTDEPHESREVQRADGTVQTDEVPTTPKPTKLNRSAQTDPGLDISTRYRDLMIRCKTQEVRNQKERENLTAELKKYEGLLSEGKAGIEMKEIEITKLKDSISFLKTEHERSQMPKKYAESEIQCNYMAELIERARSGEHGLLPENFPDISKMAEDIKRLTQEVFLLKAKNAKYNSEPPATTQNKTKFNMEWAKPPSLSSSSPRMFENKMPQITKDQPTYRRTPSVIHRDSVYPTRPQNPTNSLGQNSNHSDSDSSSRTDSFKLPYPAKLKNVSENLSSTCSVKDSPLLSKFISPPPGQETVIENHSKSQSLRDRVEIFKEITENHTPPAALPPQPQPAQDIPKPKIANNRDLLPNLHEETVMETDEDFADEIERMLGMK